MPYDILQLSVESICMTWKNALSIYAVWFEIIVVISVSRMIRQGMTLHKLLVYSRIHQSIEFKSLIIKITIACTSVHCVAILF